MNEKEVATTKVEVHPDQRVSFLEPTTSLQQKPKTQEYGLVSLIGMGYATSNTAMCVTASLVTGIASGGPIIFTWGQIMIFVFALCVACSLAELSSAFPHPGGQYYWAAQLAPDRYKRVISYFTGVISWAGVVVSCASGILSIPQMAIGMYMLKHPDLEFHPWMLFVGYQVTNLAIFFTNLVERYLPHFSLFTMWWSLVSVVIIFVSVLAASPTKQSGDFVFTDFLNSSGWTDGVAYLTGMVGANWGFTSLDAVTHMAEEIPNPRTNIPRVLITTVVVGLVVSLPYSIGLMFSIQNVDEVVSTPTGVPSLELFRQALGSDAGALGLQALVLVAFVGALSGVQTWQSRVAWAFARDHGWPMSGKLSQLAPAPFETPIWAHVWCSVWVALLGCLYLGSSVAFNSFVGCSIMFQYLSYSICIVLLLMKGRNNIKHGPFWYPKLGLIANVVTVFWFVITLVFYCFPTALPVIPSSMNYASCVFVFIFIYAAAYWYIWGRKSFTTPPELEDEYVAEMEEN